MFLLILPTPVWAGQIDYPKLEQDIVNETNLLRANPAAYQPKLEGRLASFRGRRFQDADGVWVETAEGKRAVREAIAVLGLAPSCCGGALTPLTRLEGLDDAAVAHAVDQGSTGAIGHRGSDGSQPHERVSAVGRWRGVTAENIYYGGRTAEEIVLGLLIDDGVADRGHRKVLLDSRLEVVGVACGPHKSEFEVVCVMEYAADFASTTPLASR